MSRILLDDGLPDDRIVCPDCALSRPAHHGNLFCSTFRCDTIPDLRRRCVKFVPRKGLADQRTGAQRWPTIQAEIEEVSRMDAARNAQV